MQIVFNAKDMSIKQYKAFLKSQQTGDFDLLLSSVIELIVSWDLPGDFKDLEYWDTLKVTQWVEIRDMVGQELEKTFSTKK